MHINRTLRSAALALAAAACHLAAADVQWGATAGVAFPALDLKDGMDNRKGLTFGAQATLSLGHGHAIRPRLDIARYQAGVTQMQGFSVGASLDTLKLGADYIYSFDGEGRGAYVFAGLGGVASRGVIDLYIPGLPASAQIQTTNTPYAQLGLGYQFTRTWGIEAYHARNRSLGATIAGANVLAVTARF